MHYKNSAVFEEKVLGRRVFGELGYDGPKDFSGSLIPIICQARKTGYKHPDTEAGKLLYYGVKTQLEKRKINADGLIFVPTIGSIVDQYHQTDAFFWLPIVRDFLVTIDLFNLDTVISAILRDLWEIDHKACTEEDFQLDLFLHKKGLSSRLLSGGHDTVSGWTRIFSPNKDLWSCSLKNGKIKARQENHFILIPEYIIFKEKRRRFCRVIAECFLKRVSKYNPVG